MVGLREIPEYLQTKQKIEKVAQATVFFPFKFTFTGVKFGTPGSEAGGPRVAGPVIAVSAEDRGRAAARGQQSHEGRAEDARDLHCNNDILGGIGFFCKFEDCGCWINVRPPQITLWEWGLKNPPS